MSFPKKDRKVRSVSGITFPVGRFADAIAAALHQEYGATHAAVKTVVGLTGANQRAVKNWFEAKNGPSGDFLIALCRHSEKVLETVLLLAGREKQMTSQKIAAATNKVREILVLLDELQEP